jgi:hypothetical protein
MSSHPSSNDRRSSSQSNLLALLAILIAIAALAVDFIGSGNNVKQASPYITFVRDTAINAADRSNGAVVLLDKADDGISVPPISRLELCNFGAGMAKNIQITWTPTHVAGHYRDSDHEAIASLPEIWKESSTRIPALTSGEHHVFLSLPEALRSPNAKDIGYLYGLLTIEYEDALGRKYKRTYSVDMNFPDDKPRVYFNLVESTVPVFENDHVAENPARKKHRSDAAAESTVSP